MPKKNDYFKDFLADVLRQSIDLSDSTDRTELFTRPAHGSGVYDPTLASGGSLFPKAIVQEISESYAGSIWGTSTVGKTWLGRLTARAFKYGDIVHHKDSPDQREMVVNVGTYTVETIVIDDEGNAQGLVTEYTADVLEYVE